MALTGPKKKTLTKLRLNRSCVVDIFRIQQANAEISEGY